MIKTTNGEVELDGRFIVLIADFTVITRAIYESTRTEFGDSNVRTLLNDCLQAAIEEDVNTTEEMFKQTLRRAMDNFEKEVKMERKERRK